MSEKQYKQLRTWEGANELKLEVKGNVPYLRSEINRLNNVIAERDQELSEAAKREEEAFCIGWNSCSVSNNPFSGAERHTKFLSYLKTKKAEAIISKNIEGFKYLADKEQKE